ncbi:MAG: hypothetical protein Kow00108_02660 [Calditrichia bacterium]
MKKVFVLLLMIISFQIATAQKIVCTVKFDLQYLQQEGKDIVADLQNRLEDYVNSYDYMEDKLELVIPVKINIIFESVSQSASNNEFKAQFLISSPSGENYYDKSWMFKYTPGELIIHDETQLHPITTLIDYYIYLVLGGELDGYSLLGGTEAYEKARNIVTRAASLGGNWSSRDKDFQELMDGRLLPLREAKYYFYRSAFLIEVALAKNLKAIRTNNKLCILKLQEAAKQFPNSKHIKRFFDYHYQEFCKLLQYEESEELIDMLIAIDPVHRAVYENCNQ